MKTANLVFVKGRCKLGSNRVACFRRLFVIRTYRDNLTNKLPVVFVIRQILQNNSLIQNLLSIRFSRVTCNETYFSFNAFEFFLDLMLRRQMIATYLRMKLVINNKREGAIETFLSYAQLMHIILSRFSFIYIHIYIL